MAVHLMERHATRDGDVVRDGGAERDSGAARGGGAERGRGSVAPPTEVVVRSAPGLRAAPVACSRAGSREGYRMGRWERLAMTVVVVAALVVGALTVALRPAVAPVRLVTAQPGDTVQSIVEREVPEMDPVDAAAQVVVLNDLSQLTLSAGVVVRIPAS